MCTQTSVYMYKTRSAYMCTSEYMYNLERIHMSCVFDMLDECLWDDTMIFSDVLGI